MSRRIHAASLAAIVVLASLVVVAPTVATAASTNAQPTATNASSTSQLTTIDSCTVIDEPGRYVLTENVTNSTAGVCIDIRSSDVHFNGNNHLVAGNLSRADINETIDGPPPRTRVGVGVNVRSPDRVQNVTVERVEVSNWNHGVLAENVTDSTTTDVVAHDNGGGIIYDDSSDVAVTDSNASRNLILGVIVDSRSGVTTSNNTVARNTLRDNGVFGVAVFLSNGSTVANNTATGNTFGVLAYGTTNTTIVDNRAASNSYGLVLEGFRQNATNVTDVPDGIDQSAPPTNSRENIVLDNVLVDNTYAGLAFGGSDRNYAEGNTVSDTGPAFDRAYPFQTNTSAGVVAVDAQNNTVVDLEARDLPQWLYAGFNDSTTVVENATTDAGNVSFAATDVGVSRVIDVPTLPNQTVALGPKLETTTFGSNETLSVLFTYDESDLEAFNASETELAAYAYDRETGEWRVLDETEVFPDRNRVAVTLTDPDGFLVFLAQKNLPNETTENTTPTNETNENATTTTETARTVASEP